MAYIPPEIWLYVGSFIPDEALSQIRCVNKVFLDLAMNVRWREVTISTKNISQALRILHRLSDPFVARRMKALVLRLATPDPIRCNMTFDPLFLKRIVSNHVRERRSFCFDSFENVLDTIISASCRFLTLSILTLDFSLVAPSYRLRLEPFFTSLWPSIGHRLHGLYLKGNLKAYRALLQSASMLPSVRELGLEFINNRHDSDADADAVVLLDNIVPFVNKLSPHLEGLSIRSHPSYSVSADLSLFFIHLSSFPVLRSLDLRLVLNKPFCDPSGLQTLITNSSHTVQELALRLNPSGMAMESMVEERLTPLLLDSLLDSHSFTRVQSLDIYPTREPEGPLIVLSFIRRSSQYLKELIIHDRYFHMEEMMLVVEAASECRNLASMQFNVWYLDILLLDRLSVKLPHLQSLRISTIESSVDGFPCLFVQDLKSRSYVGWRLKDISVCYGDREVEPETMRALGRSIPSVSSFFGRGHKDFKATNHKVLFANTLGSRFDGLFCSSA
ncbi:hypothetical protein CPB84DRAFT_1672576 [Gymnopilus junonius]|uniref:F-box domain-containing protein n=1 Tax=Gymnopilus junonius TaxID=109634 RepID=A0A9P5NY05_GYMJU|nr:hypothetical protein CPB84DRAFT_1672576 [Gymnopilus junonius]